MAAGQPLSEFELIGRYFKRPMPPGVLGPGDDCALLPAGRSHLAVSTDMLVAGRHFFDDVEPRRLGHKALAVNLSDLAAMAAQPAGCVLALALPSADEAWVAAFAEGWYALADRWNCPLVGGDTTRARHDLAITVTVLGEVPARQALRRDAARQGDDIWVSGCLGAAEVALQLAWSLRGLPMAAGQSALPLQRWVAGLKPPEREQWWRQTRDALELPEPRIGLGLALRGVAHAALDISDGLLQDLGHILAASNCGAEVRIDDLPLGALSQLPPEAAWQAALGGGDAYELCFTAAPARRAEVQAASRDAGVAVARIGAILPPAAGLRIIDPAGSPLAPWVRGYDHFAETLP
ncbi:MAG: thiamine-phosphate kinase [Pigmentiphaga sp.]